MAAHAFRFLHTSDLHLDQPPGGLTDLPTELVDLLIDASYRAVDVVVDTAIREEVAFVLLSGDVLALRYPHPRAVDFLAVQFHRLAEHQIPVYWLGGTLEAGNALPTELDQDHVHFFRTGEVETLEFRQQRKTLAYLVGQSHGAHAFANLEEMRVPRDGRFFVGLHYVTDPHALSQDELDELGIDYWALGGQHARRALDTLIPAEFPGSPQGRHPREAGAHGCLVVSVSGDDIEATRFVETDSVRYRTETIEVVAEDTPEKLTAKMKSRLQTIRHDVDAQKPILVSWEILDDGPLGKDLRRRGQAQQFLEQFRRETRELHGAAKQMWSLELACRRRQVPAHLYDEDSILGDFLRVLRDEESSPDPTLDMQTYIPETPAAEAIAAELAVDAATQKRQLLGAVTTLGIDLLSGEAS